MQRILASSMLLVAACDLAGQDVDGNDGIVLDASERSASSPAIVAGMGPGDGESWVVVQTGEVKGWGRRWCDADGCREPADIEPVELDGPAVEVSSNGDYTAVLLADGRVQGLGPTLADVLDPRPVELGGAVVQIAVGLDFVCARSADGGVRCRGIEGTTGPGWLGSVPSIEAAVDLSAGAGHACALSSAGDVTCWGSNDHGQLGSADASSPTVVALAGPATDVAAGGEHTCALLEIGIVQCWGSNAEGQLGHAGSGVGSVPLPEPAASIAAGAEHGCAITETTGSLHCWGSNALGQLGAGEDSSAGIRRVDLGGLRAAAVLAGATASTTFAVLETGGLRGWGNDDAGQAGYGDRMDGVEDETWRIGELPDIPIFRAPKK